MGCVESMNRDCTVDNGTQYSVPFMGATYDFQTAQYLDTGSSAGATVPSINSTLTQTSIGNAADISFNFTNGDPVFLSYRWLQPILEWRIDVLHANTTFKSTRYGFDKDVEAPLTTSYMPVRANAVGLDVVGTIAAAGIYTIPFFGLFATPDGTELIRTTSGSYRFVMRTLRMDMDREKSESWESWLSGAVTITSDEVELPGIEFPEEDLAGCQLGAIL
ncbi:hypothetical protein EDB81DRAFT_886912 [Dactylonectria macrodidyma]|uniref:Uncharacterized protein n=1 Tax=Dactylonectria macrodidyma TaxID=307937 RepID=A0A9P9IXD1_9HYPO|nr:hypothetical protein EDB81DRAFT_886912 [Dactylonectria macrodidyma]